MSVGSHSVDSAVAPLGTLQQLELSAGTLRYHDQGSGTPLVLLAGLLLPGAFWRKVVPALEQPVRAIVPDLPLGGHSIPMRPDADLSPPAIADLVAELLEALDVRDAIVVGNDTGGAIAQLLVTRHPERIGGLVLTPCDAFDNFFPPRFRYLQALPYIPGGVWQLAQGLRFRQVRALPIALGALAKYPLDPAIYSQFARPVIESRGIRHDLGKVLRGVRARHTQRAASDLPHFNRPALIAWASEDRVFPSEDAERLAEILPQGKLVSIPDSFTYIPEDQPVALARELDAFLA